MPDVSYTFKLFGANKFTKSLGRMQANAGRLRKSMGSITDTAAKFSLVGDAFQQASQQLNSLIQPGQQFESQMKDLQAITGMAGKNLEIIGKAARKNAKIFGGEASQSVESYKLLLSQLGPELAEKPEALKAMGRNVSILSKTMGGDAKAATEVLTAAMNQYGVSIDDPTQASARMSDMMNTMAAAAKQGSAELPFIKKALENAGAVAKDAGVSFSETNSAIQLLDKYGKRGAEGGVALRNIMSRLQKGRFLPPEVKEELRGAGINIDVLTDKSRSLTERMQALQPIAEDTALLTKMFGQENQLAATTLVKNADAIEDLNGKIQGTNTATEQAEIVMSSYEEKMNRLQARFKDLGIQIFNASKKYLPLIMFTSQFMQITSRMMPLMQSFGKFMLWSGRMTFRLGRSLLMGSIQLLKFGLRLVFVSAKMTGRFLIGLVKGIAGLVTYRRQINRTSFSLMTFVRRIIMSGAAAAKSAGRFLLAAVSGLGSYVAGLVSATAAQIALNVAMNANPIGAIILGLMAIGTAVYAIIKHWDTVKEWLKNLGEFVLKYNPFSLLLKGIDKLFPGFLDTLKQWWNKITDFFKKIGDWFKKIWDKYLAPLFGASGDVKIEGEEPEYDPGKGSDKPGGSKEKNPKINKEDYGLEEDSASKSKNTAGKRASSTISGGGKSVKNISITIDSLIGENTNFFRDTDSLEDGEDFLEKLSDALQGVVNDANYATE